MKEKLPFTPVLTKHMSDEECITMCMLKGHTMPYFFCKHLLREHDVWYVSRMPRPGDGPYEQYINKHTEPKGNDYKRFYFLSRGEACRVVCEVNEWSFAHSRAPNFP